MTRFRVRLRSLLAIGGLIFLVGCQTWSGRLELPSGNDVSQSPPKTMPPLPAISVPRELAQQVSPGEATPSLPARPAQKITYIAELIDILEQTKSVDAFMATVSLLAESLQAEAKQERQSAIPVVIRNAERLAIYGRHVLDDEASGVELAKQLTNLLRQMARDKASTKHRKNSKKPVAAGPITPVPPWAIERMEAKYSEKNDFRTRILPPIRAGFPPPQCENPPDDATVLRALGQEKRGVPFVFEEGRKDITITCERLLDKIDPPRFFPMVGPAQLHHCRWKCTVSYTETIESSYPFPYRTTRPRTAVVYLDQDHLHLFTGDAPKETPSMDAQDGAP